jgi:PPM family protein phosphatase
MMMRWLWDALRIHKAAPNREAQAGGEPSSETGTVEAKRTIFSPLPHICAITDTGRVRDHNEDAYCISPDYSWFAVADGMGGHEAGEVAAALAIQALVEYITPERMATALAADTIGPLLLNAVTAAHELVLEANQGKEGGKEMGCTLAVASIANGLVTCHVGDVRCYIMRGGVLCQATHDHSTVGALVDAGLLTPEEARVHPDKNQVLQAIGMPMGVSPDVTSSTIFTADRILVCSDGLWEALPHEEIQTILAWDGAMGRLASQLVDRANDAGGRDNITAILFQVVPEKMAHSIESVPDELA